MSNPRIYQATDFNVNDTVKLSDESFGHVIRVLRLTQGDVITLFTGNENKQYTAELADVNKKQASVLITAEETIERESPLDIHLGQGISRGDRMDFTLQKSVELGVKSITPLFTERCGVKLSGERLSKKQQQWQKIVVSACEQSGRVFVPIVNTPISLAQWLEQQTNALKLNLHPKASHSIMTLPADELANDKQVRLLIGPEGGLSEEEIQLANEADFTDVLLGPRVLRTETAALTAITALQCRFGDLT